MQQQDSRLVRIGIFYDGSFFWRVSNFFKHRHPRGSYLDLDGLHDYIRQRVADFETGGDVARCRIVESHFFRGRFSLKSVQAMKEPLRQLEVDRYQDQILMRAGVVAHYHPMNESVDPPEEKGIDVWMALEAFDAARKGLDVLVLFSGDSDFVPLARKLHGLGTRVLVLGVDMEAGSRTSQKLLDEATYTVMLTHEVDDAVPGNALVAGLFRTPPAEPQRGNYY